MRSPRELGFADKVVFHPMHLAVANEVFSPTPADRRRPGRAHAEPEGTRNDFHDWDLAASPILITSRGGRRMVVVAGKDGHVYGLSRDLRDMYYSSAACSTWQWRAA
jgi:hypothetical protein